MRFLDTLFGARRRPLPFVPPQDPVCLIGDLHGRADLLVRMLDLARRRAGPRPLRLVFCGDMIDRGPSSADVLQRLFLMSEADPARVICLMGNHEHMLLAFLADPPAAGPRWIQAGGGATLISYGLHGRNDGDSPAARFHRIADRLQAAMPAGMPAWLAGLPLLWRDGALAASHAGADPARSLEDQTDAALLWGHRDFAARPRRDGLRDGLWLVHGHVIQDAPSARDGRIAVDTGAWRSGILSAAWCDAEGLRFLSCGPQGDRVGDVVLPAAGPSGDPAA